MPDPRRRLTRADLPAEITPESIRELSLSELRRLARHGNGVLDPAEQATYDAALHEVMSGTAERIERQLGRAGWAGVRRDAARRGPRRGGDDQSRIDEQLERVARRIDQQVDLAGTLAPGVDWSFAQPEDEPEDEPKDEPEPTPKDEPEETGSGDGTVSDLEQYLSEQVELVQVMTEMAEVSKRTYALEQQRDLQNTRSVFFGFVVSVAVLVAGWAPLVAAEDWDERLWIVGLSLATCLVAGVVYALVRRYQVGHQPTDDDSGS